MKIYLLWHVSWSAGTHVKAVTSDPVIAEKWKDNCRNYMITEQDVGKYDQAIKETRYNNVDMCFRLGPASPSENKS